MSQDYETRRRFPRIPVENAVLIAHHGDELHEEFSKTRSVGLGGCMFASDRSFGVDSHLELLLTLRRKVVKVRARVAYERQINGKWEVGAEFMELDDEARQQVAEYLGNLGPQ